MKIMKYSYNKCYFPVEGKIKIGFKNKMTPHQIWGLTAAHQREQDIKRSQNNVKGLSEGHLWHNMWGGEWMDLNYAQMALSEIAKQILWLKTTTKHVLLTSINMFPWSSERACLGRSLRKWSPSQFWETTCFTCLDKHVLINPMYNYKRQYCLN